MTKTKLLIALKNVVWLILVALPAFFLLVWVQALIEGAYGSRNLSYALETGAFYYLGSVLYVCLGGVVHQAIILCMPAIWSRFVVRITAVLLTSVIPLLFILLGERVQTITEFVIPIILTLGVYGLLIKLPGIGSQVSGMPA
ncbi:MAG: hypothetical protein EA364_02965 [Balneolaceae bacterium]|nr:MAG: hypothetical protein EA364_02965 [Balneolaceae bacterium]